MNQGMLSVSVRSATGLLLLLLWVPANAQGAEPDRVDFLRDVRPILAEHCWKCHGRDDPESGLRLTDRESVLGSADSGRVIVVPGKPEESELIRRLEATDDERMPPADEKPLTPEQIHILRQWVRQGASWSAHWSFEPIRPVEPPQVKNEQWIRNDLDRFVLARLEAKGWTPSPEADRYTLIRRLSYDLLGLPPTPEEADAFVRDDSAKAYENLVDRLLASPHFGERWGRHWLDLAHYADSDGYEKDRARPDAYRFRDWVIQAINDDLPFDRFTVEQIAGDLLENATARQRLATAFLRQTLTNEEGGVDQEEYRIAAVFDRTETVSTVWLGLTMNCARCHDHKYDPLTQKDYYQLFAFFNNAEEVTTPLPIAGRDIAQYERRVAPLQQALLHRYQELAPAERQWETEEHRRILAQPEGVAQETPVRILDVRSAVSDNVKFLVEGQSAFRQWEAAADASGPESDAYVVTVALPAMDFTGLKLYCLADERLPQRGPGWAENGNFVLTGLQVQLLASDGTATAVPLHRATSDFAQKGFEPDKVAINQPAEGNGSPRGWAIAGKVGQDHWIQWRTYEPISVVEGTKLRIVLDQRFGTRHLIGRFRIAALAGGSRGLHLDNAEIADYLEMYPEKRVARMKERLFDYYVTEVARDEQVRRLRQEIAELTREHEIKFDNVRTVGTPVMPRQSFIFHRGEFLSPTTAVEPGVPAVLPPLSVERSAGPLNRLHLAQWLVSADNPLTARVAVNHVWQHLFGAGLVRTANDFGMRGELPTHPELLDWLAYQFRGPLGWSRKQLIRLIVTSATYRQTSWRRPEYDESDPENRLLFRQNRFRVEAEIVRDVYLAASGLLSRKIGGPSVFPPMPEDLAELSYANNFTWKASVGEDRYRRGMYTFFKRTIPHPNLMTFDAPDANLPCVQRTVSNTPLQSLLLLNNEVHLEAAQALARWLLEQGAAFSDEQKLTLVWRRCLTRPPQPGEVHALEKLLASARQYYADQEKDAQALVGKYAPPSDAVGEQAAWTIVARTILNVDEMITRE